MRRLRRAWSKPRSWTPRWPRLTGALLGLSGGVLAAGGGVLVDVLRDPEDLVSVSDPDPLIGFSFLVPCVGGALLVMTVAGARGLKRPP
ncbi:hypothetical protein AB0E82_31210 [Streptomyces anulatus]|uniref:hypothetical protein n=1 Tax=Streptomyces anulatus TaxID=1892 RepID=UPI0033C4440F